MLQWVKTHELAIRSAILAQLAATPEAEVYDVAGKERLANDQLSDMAGALEEELEEIEEDEGEEDAEGGTLEEQEERAEEARPRIRRLRSATGGPRSEGRRADTAWIRAVCTCPPPNAAATPTTSPPSGRSKAKLGGNLKRCSMFFYRKVSFRSGS